jgi:hypothetical protein
VLIVLVEGEGTFVVFDLWFGIVSKSRIPNPSIFPAGGPDSEKNGP